jgi:hypothetical protein
MTGGMLCQREHAARAAKKKVNQHESWKIQKPIDCQISGSYKIKMESLKRKCESTY